MSIEPIRNATPKWTIVVDDACPIVHKLGWFVRQFDKDGNFTFIGRSTADGADHALLKQLDETPWSLMLIAPDGRVWLGPEAIPFILKDLPSGRLAAVTYTVPGTMWLTRQLYYMVSRNRRLIAERHAAAERHTASSVHRIAS